MGIEGFEPVSLGAEQTEKVTTAAPLLEAIVLPLLFKNENSLLVYFFRESKLTFL